MSRRFTAAYRFLVGERSVASLGATEFFWRATWLVASVVVVTYACLLYFGSVNAWYDRPPQPVKIVVESSPGQHLVRGSIPVPTDCHELQVKVEPRTETVFHLLFTTWQEPTRRCEKVLVERNFSTVVFSNHADISLTASLDDSPLPVRLIAR